MLFCNAFIKVFALFNYTHATLHIGVIHRYYEQKLALIYSFTITITPMKQEQRNRVRTHMSYWSGNYTTHPIKIKIYSNYIIIIQMYIHHNNWISRNYHY